MAHCAFFNKYFPPAFKNAISFPFALKLLHLKKCFGSFTQSAFPLLKHQVSDKNHYNKAHFGTCQCLPAGGFIEKTRPIWLRISFLFLFFSLTIQIKSQGKPCTPSDTPDLIKIARIFAQNYDFALLGEANERIGFIHNPSGWYVTFTTPDGELTKKIEIWSSDRGYLIEVDTSGVTKEVNLPELIQAVDVYEFKIHPYYGYTGWMQDVIRIYGVKEPDCMSDNELYGLGKAYSQSASDILWAHSVYSVPERSKGENAGKRDLREYMRLSEKAFETYQILRERNPAYLTIIGTIDLKYANEVMARYYELKLFGFTKQARRLAKNTKTLNRYSPFWEKYAFEVLNSLDSNSILFTNGDNDTYPLLYLQETQSIREDVLIINLSLLNDPVYFNLLNESIPGQKLIIPSLKKEDVSWLGAGSLSIERYGIYYDTLSIQQTIEIIDIQKKEGIKSVTLPWGRYEKTFVTKEGLIDTLYVKSPQPGSQLTLSGFLATGISLSQAGNRPVAFIKNMQPEFMEFFPGNELLDRGLVYSLEKPGKTAIFLNNQWYEPWSINKLVSLNMESMSGTNSLAEKIVNDLYLEAEIFMIYQEKDFQKKNAMMKDFLKKYTPRKIGLNHFYLFVADDLYLSGDSEAEAKSAFGSMFNSFKDSVHSFHSVNCTNSAPWELRELRYLNWLCDLLIHTSYVKDHPGMEDTLFEYKSIINTKLLEFPQMEIN